MRGTNQDFLHSMRFHVEVILPATSGGVLNDTMLGEVGAGFSAVTTPEISVESVEYREGQYIYTRKQPGNPSVGSDCTMSRGVTATDSKFWSWIKAEIEGTGEYRVDLRIKHYHREGLVGSPTGMDVSKVPARSYVLHECFPTRHKLAGDMDATASEISIQELDVAYEWFHLEDQKDYKPA